MCVLSLWRAQCVCVCVCVLGCLFMCVLSLWRARACARVCVCVHTHVHMLFISVTVPQLTALSFPHCRPLRPKFIHPVNRKGASKPPTTTGSQLANKENTHRATTTKKVEDEKTVEAVPVTVQENQEY